MNQNKRNVKIRLSLPHFRVRQFAFSHVLLSIKQRLSPLLNFIRDRWVWANKRARFSFLFITGVIIASNLAAAVNPFLVQYSYALGKSEKLLAEKDPTQASFLKFDTAQRMFTYTSGSASGNQTNLMTGGKSQPGLSMTAYTDASKGISVTDSTNKVDFKVTPKYDLAAGQQDGNRIVYPLVNQSGWLVYTMTSVGPKEDIVLNSVNKNQLQFEYDLDIDNGLDARVGADGSVNVFGNQLFSSQISTGSDKDAALLQKARKNASKNTLLFTIPAPVIKESGKQTGNVTAKYQLDGNKLTLNVTGLKAGSYPLTIDPSIYVVTAYQFMYGNNESNINFDVNNKLIKKGATTGARFDSWQNTQNLPIGTWQSGSVASGGYIYQVGGASFSGQAISTQGSSTYVVPSGVTAITVDMWGAGGGGGTTGATGGGGGAVNATIPVTAGQSLTAYVGGGGGTGGGGGGGGGYSSLSIGGTTLMIAGGGGGGGANSSVGKGGGGGANAGSGSGGSGATASAGTASGGTAGGGGGTSGGAAGTGSCNGTAGGSLTGGSGATSAITCGLGSGGAGGATGGGNGGFSGNCLIFSTCWGGGGGASGYFGGGGGGDSTSSASGGGGGSNYCNTTYTNGGAGLQTCNQYYGGGSPTAGSGTNAVYRGTAGDGGAAGTAGNTGLIIITTNAIGNPATATINWSKFDTGNGTVVNADPGTGTCSGWCSSPSYNMPDNRSNFALVAYNGYLYAMGGNDINGPAYINRKNTIYVAKLGANGEPRLWSPTSNDPTTWSYWYSITSGSNALPTGASGAGLINAAAVAYNNKMYYMGGITNDSAGNVLTNKVYVANILPNGNLGAWSTSTNLPSAMYGMTALTYNDRLYILGGATSVGGAPIASVYYIGINSDGSLASTWTQTNSFTTGRINMGGNNAVVWGGYVYITGGCSAVNGSGYCTTVDGSTQIASINADGSLDAFQTISGVTEARMGFGMLAWRDNIYVVGGCTAQDGTSGACLGGIQAGIDYGAIPQGGEVSTVQASSASGAGTCTSGSLWTNCNLTAATHGTSTAVVNGYLYVMGGCTNVGCTTVSNGIQMTGISPTGDLVEPTTCPTGSANSGGWCVFSSNLLSSAVAMSAATVFNNNIYLVGGITGSAINGNIQYTTVNSDGSLDTWTSQTLASVSATNVSYAYATTRANPSGASSTPGNLYIFGGCTTSGSGSACSAYTANVYKCTIIPSGAVGTGSNGGAACTNNSSTVVQLPTATAAMSGATYGNYIYLLGGKNGSSAGTNTVYIGKFDSSNNITGTSTVLTTSSQTLPYNVVAGSAYAYNGFLYLVAGYDTGGAAIKSAISYAKIDTSSGDVSTTWNTSAVTLAAGRWATNVPVVNGEAYMIGGCTAGAALTCTTSTASIERYQIYNDNSGSPASWAATANTYGTSPNRLGAAGAILNGYMYIAGGCTSTATDCDTNITNNVAYAAIDSYGNLGTWSNATNVLPVVSDGRAWGKLLAAGGTLYYLGGVDKTNTPVANVYYANTFSSGNITAAWSSTTSLPTALSQFGATVWNNTLYIVGGQTTAGGTTNYTTPGSYTFPVPSGVSAVNVTAWGGGGGGGGGSSSPGTGGAGAGGAYAAATLTGLTGGSTSLTIYVGGGGAGGANSGGTYGAGGGGGGYSGAYNGATQLLVAAGGGGGGGPRAGSGGGAGGTGGDNVTGGTAGTAAGNGGGGGGGTLSGGGAGGTSTISVGGTGTQPNGGAGGAGTTSTTGGGGAGGTNGGGAGGVYNSASGRSGAGGGGAGYWGGGGGGAGNNLSPNAGGGGGGGSSYVTASSTGVTVNAGSGTSSGFTNGGAITTGNGGAGATGTNAGTSGNNGAVYVTYSGNYSNTVYTSPALPSGGAISGWTGSPSNAQFNVARGGMTAVAYSNNLYILGGFDGSNFMSDTQFAKIDSSTGYVGSWSYGKSLPTATANGDGFAANGYIYLLGGRASIAGCSSNTYIAPISGNTPAASGNNPTGLGDWFLTNAKFAGTNPQRYGNVALYSGGKAYMLGGACNTGSSITYPGTASQQTALLAQPQIAKYSISFDTDTDVYPSIYVFNGLDNGTSAHWQFTYRSSTDPGHTWTGTTGQACSSSVMSDWGQSTTVSSLTLPEPNPKANNGYTPKDGSGTNTSCARYYFFNLSVDAQQTFGFPDDVSRGPTITDISLQYTGDPSKRLMHGRTFVNEAQSPDDTPAY